MEWKLAIFSSVKAQTEFKQLTVTPSEFRRYMKEAKKDKLTREAYEAKIEEVASKAINELPAKLKKAKDEKEQEKLAKQAERDVNGLNVPAKEWMRKYKDGACFIFGEVTVEGDAYQVLTRCAVVLDIDHNANGIRKSFEESFPYMAFIYDSFNSTAQEEKFRIVIPLDADYVEEDYSVLWEHCAQFLPEDAVDATSIQFKRKMYLPRYMEGGLYRATTTKASSILSISCCKAKASAEPTKKAAASNKPVVQRAEKKKQQNPLTKAGFIGAFNRHYSIKEAIEKFIPDVYAEGSKDDRLTYIAGSTTDGVVLYGMDGYYTTLYSNHDSDPCSRKLVSAFDLIRIHLYGDTEDSFAQMRDEIVFNDEACQEALNLDAMLAKDNFGNISQTYNNIKIALTTDEHLKGKLWFNVLANEEYLRGKVPWSAETADRAIKDQDLRQILLYMEKKYDLRDKNKIYDTVDAVCGENPYDPVKDYINELPAWDGKKRIDTLLHEYLGAEKNEYTAAAMRVTLMGALNRLYRAGCKFETMLVLVSPEEGIGKSTFFRKLASDAFFSDNFSSLDAKTSFEQIGGKWIVESSELEGMNRGEVQQIYNFLSRQTDKFRAAYGRKAEEHKRRFIMVGSTNTVEFLRGVGENRRFYPVLCSPISNKSVFTDLTQEVVNQVWAEALVLFNAGEPCHLSGAILDVARGVQRAHKDLDDNIGVIESYLNMPCPAKFDELTREERLAYIARPDVWQGEPREKISSNEVFFEALNPNAKSAIDFGRKQQKDVARLMAQFSNFERPTTTKNTLAFGRVKYYRRK